MQWLWSVTTGEVDFMVLPAEGEGGCMINSQLGEIGFGLLDGEVGFMTLPTGGEGSTPHWGREWMKWLWYSYWESWFHGYSLLGERVGCMVSLRWGEGGLHGFSPLGERVVKWLWSSRWGSRFHGYSPLGKRVIAWFLPTVGEGGCMVTPRWGRGLSVCKVNSCFVCCCVRFSVANFVCPVVVVLILYLIMYFNLFWLLVSCYPFFFRYLVIS